MKNLPLLLGTLVGTFLLVFVVAFVFSKKANTPVDTTKLMGDARLATGSAQAKVTVVEFSDLQCPACKAIDPFVKQVIAAHPDSVRLIYRHFPLAQHQWSTIAAQAAETVASVSTEKFWLFHDIMFANQETWSAQSEADAKKSFGEYAASIGVPAELITTSLDKQTFKAQVEKDLADGNALGVNATPTFYVNGQKIQSTDLQATVEKFVQQ